jgi:hypothetical protein
MEMSCIQSGRRLAWVSICHVTVDFSVRRKAFDMDGSNRTENVVQSREFEFRSWRFLCIVGARPNGYYEPVVICRGRQGETAEEFQLPNDTDEEVYETEAEALRHTEQQAVRWVNDRSGMGHVQS